MKKPLLVSLFATMSIVASAAQAQVSYTFDTGNQGWTTGNVSGVGPDTSAHASSWAAGQLVAVDEAGETGVYAPDAVLGNQSAAYGGSISFDVSDAFNDSVAYPALILYGANGLAAAVSAGPPSTDANALTTYSFVLNESVFSQFTGGNGLAGPITQAQFQSILADLSGIAFRTEYKTGPDDSRFDNAIFAGFVDRTAPGAVPEPATWGMMIAGFGAMGLAMRRKSKASTRVRYAV